MIYIAKLEDGSFKRNRIKRDLINDLLEPEIFEIRVSKYIRDYYLCISNKERFEKLKFVTDQDDFHHYVVIGDREELVGTADEQSAFELNYEVYKVFMKKDRLPYYDAYFFRKNCKRVDGKKWKYLYKPEYHYLLEVSD